eukprot:scaffold1090_cov265-Pinguiococcus_pyrenoidosus.AAC.18
MKQANPQDAPGQPKDQTGDERSAEALANSRVNAWSPRWHVWEGRAACSALPLTFTMTELSDL